MKTAVIDLGTNTSNLVVAEIVDNNAEILHQGKEYVRLGDQRINKNEISEEALQRVLAALDRQVLTAREYCSDNIRIIATSAIRQAHNQKQVTDAILEKTGIETEVIDGDREATLIYYGVKLALGKMDEPSAILDIGGGSNEIIISDNGTLLWKGSFPAGMSRIIHSFRISDPITPAESETLAGHYHLLHSEALEQCRKYGIKTLIGCSGAFNTLADILDEVDPEERFRKKKQITLDEFDSVYRRIIPSTEKERKIMKGMDPVRTELIVPAMILSRTFIDHTPVNKILQTSYSLREGVLYEMISSGSIRQP
jgi:exopolyphosphatase / guanosine-5'-triphosphate,3'-diphosphate pyrophosphatase